MVAATKTSPSQRLRAAAAQAMDTSSMLRERKLRAELDHERAKNRQLASDLEHAIGRGEVLNELAECRYVERWGRHDAKIRGQNSVILALSDWHLGETVNPRTVNGINEFNMAIARRRVERVFRWAVRIIETQNAWLPVSEVVVAVLGDIITGYLHEELLESCDASPTESVLVGKELLASGLTFLAKQIKRPIRVVTAYGNHGRTTQKIRFSTGYKNSYEWLLYRDLAHTFRNDKRFAFNVGDGRLNWATVQGHPCRFHHGDDIRYAGGVGGIAIPVNKKLAQWNKQRVSSLDVFGHWHQYTAHRWWVCNSSLIGMNAHGIAIGAEPELPSQSLVWMNRERGKVLSLQVFCEEPVRAGAVA